MSKQRQEIFLSTLSQPISHYTHAVRFGDLLFISGIIAVDARNQVVGKDDAVAQTEEIFRIMKLILDEAGADFSNVLKVNVYLTDMADRPRINSVRQKYFGTARPASTLVEVAALAIPGTKVEIEAVVGLRS
jgi:reactive intermediate/imine deaminase